MKWLIFVILVLFLFGCLEPETVYFRGIETAPVPAECTEYADDVCGLYACTVDLCWCEESPDKIVLDGSKTATNVTTEDEAINVVNFYFKSRSVLPLGDSEVLRAVKLNSLFYNVFAETSSGDELVFTVAPDGTIFKTQCGV